MHALFVLTVVLLVGECVRHVIASRGYQLLEHTLNTDLQNKSELYMNTQELVGRHGYPVESHVVTTDDGYILKIHRIPHGKDDNPSRVRPPVILMHGMGLGSDSWVLTDPDSSPGFILADSGYDVWMPNARGNFYSMKHETLSPKHRKFWEFSWHEMGVHDLPAVIDYVLQTTNQQQLFYVGHSMGSTMFFVLMSTQPQYNDKIKLMVALAPAVYHGTVRSVVGRFVLLPFARNIIDGAYRSGQLNLYPRSRDFSDLINNLCKDRRIGRMLCETSIDLITRWNRGVINETLLSTFTAHVAGTTVDSVNHYIVNIRSNQFNMYDMKRKVRAMKQYDLSKVTCPVALYYADNDVLVHPEGVLRLSRELPTVVGLTRITDERMGHIDFIIPLHAKQLVYDDVINVMNKYRSDNNDVFT